MMARPEDLLRDLVTQVSRVAYALETLAVRQGTECVAPCKDCGCTLKGAEMPATTCASCKMENAR